MSDLAYIEKRNLYIRYFPKGEYNSRVAVWRIQNAEDNYTSMSVYNAKIYNLNAAINQFLKYKKGDNE